MDSDYRLKLRAGMSSAFQSYFTLRKFLSDELNRPLNQRSPEVLGLAQNFEDVLVWAEEDGWLPDLLSAFERHPNATLRANAELVKADLAENISITAFTLSNPLDALILRPKRFFIGRANLRAILREMEGPNPTAPILMVTGLDRCGKSYSFQLLRQLSGLRQSNIVARIDFREMRGGAIAERYHDIVMQIAANMNLPWDNLPPKNESETRWFQHAIRKFNAIARQNQQRLWIVFDHVQGGAAHDSKIANAVTQIVTYAADEGSNLRVVVIGLDPKQIILEEHIRDEIKTDYAELPTKNELVDCLICLRETMKNRVAALTYIPPTDDELDDAANRIIAALSAMDPATYPSRYSEVTWQHASRLQLVP